MKKERALVVILIIFLSFLAGCIETSNNTSENGEVEDFTFTALDGSTKSLSDYRGKVVILDMWATWCGPCQVFMPELKKIYEYYSRNVLEIFSVDVDPSESAQLIQSFIDWFSSPDAYNIELNWIFGRDDGTISEKYLKGGGIPTVVIFDQMGRLHYTEAGVHGFTEIPYGFSENTPLLAPILEELIE